MYNQNPQMQQQQQQQAQQIKTIIGTDEVRQIVKCLNDKPFNENYKLVTFDELNPMELLDVLNKVLTHLDKQTFENIKSKQPDQISLEVIQFLNILSYPVPQPPNDVQFSQQLLTGDKRVIYPVLYYLLTRLEEHQKRAFLAKYLVPFMVPEDIPLDEDMKQQIEKYKDLQAEFQVSHQEFEVISQESNNPTELKKEITSLEGEKEQLINKINAFKNKNTNRPEFQALLEVTNLLRKEQEEEARLAEKIYQQKQQFEYTDQQLLASQQRLMDAKKSLSASNTAEQMLQNMRNDVKKNRELSNQRFAIEINEKKKKLEQTEKLLSEPPITQNELNHLDNQLIVLRRAVNMMEEKLSKQANPQDDKLAIYKQQAQMITRKKKKLQKNSKIQKKNNSIQKNKQQPYKKKQIKKEVKDLAILIIQMDMTDSEQMLKKLEKQKGVEGYSDALSKLNQISDQAEVANKGKEVALEEYGQLAEKYNATMAYQKKRLKRINQKFERIKRQIIKKEVNRQVAKNESKGGNGQEYGQNMNRLVL
ncbi:intraflagellar transport protein, putative [Ichthyophthirius multifiliis]|uniref:Intraflagellar transport protein, putative n=1 Tax=Ichthyophthirius multifiliis TaxID=5932 RepID=G0QPH2_ICHMU|nr:intraflagellar transport protein, putative [Ichthyophthirius multifiliis]EGR32885.1 intraflagellar transport protein, putative [Ichthyophthirius multifiliis]|eukprot:XP_004036871.1 intraflagellar transport protein, putative [Ichthyophthirius multifiliis]